MPMNFPDLDSLKKAAKVHEFRDLQLGESEQEYRNALVNHVRSLDKIESYEIKFKVRWDQWTDDQKMQSLFG